MRLAVATALLIAVVVGGCGLGPGEDEIIQLSDEQAEYFSDVEIPTQATSIDAELRWTFDNYKTAYLSFQLSGRDTDDALRLLARAKAPRDRRTLEPLELEDIETHWGFARSTDLRIVSERSGQIMAVDTAKSGPVSVYVVTIALKPACGVVRDCDTS